MQSSNRYKKSGINSISKLTIIFCLFSMIFSKVIEMKIYQIKKNYDSSEKRLKFLQEKSKTNSTQDSILSNLTEEKNETESIITSDKPEENESDKKETDKEDLAEDYNYTSHIWVVQAQIGEPPQNILLELDTTISTTWVPSVDCVNCIVQNKYNSSESRTSRDSNKTIKIEDYLGDLKGEVVRDDFKINQLGIELRNFPFVEAIELKKKYHDLPEGKLALSNINKYGDQFSFLNSLIKSGKIQKRIFALEFKKTKNGNNQNKDNKNNNLDHYFYETSGEGKFYLGDIPERVKNIPKEKIGLCNATTSEDLDDEFRDGWTCELSHIFFNHEKSLLNLTDTIELDNTRVIFDSSYEFIGVSKNQYNFIYENYLNENFKGMCRKNEKFDEIYFICNIEKDTFDKAKSLYLIIQGFIIETTARDLFIELDPNLQSYLFAVKFFDDKDESVKLWLLGQIFLKNMITIFDADSDKVSFYSKKIYNIEKDWYTWYHSDYYSLLLTRYFYLAVGAIAVVGLFLLFVCFLCIRAAKRRNLGHGPLIENEIK